MPTRYVRLTVVGTLNNLSCIECFKCLIFCILQELKLKRGNRMEEISTKQNMGSNGYFFMKNKYNNSVLKYGLQKERLTMLDIWLMCLTVRA